MADELSARAAAAAVSPPAGALLGTRGLGAPVPELASLMAAEPAIPSVGSSGRRRSYGSMQMPRGTDCGKLTKYITNTFPEVAVISDSYRSFWFTRRNRN